MQKIKGTIGPDVLRSLTPTPYANHKIVRAFRDYVEDRIENHYGVMATIAITEEGEMVFELVAKDTVVTDKQLEDFTRLCLSEFKKNPINEAYNALPLSARIKRELIRPPSTNGVETRPTPEADITPGKTPTHTPSAAASPAEPSLKTNSKAS